MEPGVDDALARWSRAGAARWPAVLVDAAQLAQHLARLGVPLASEHPHADDLYLACACAHGDTAAIAAFDGELTPVMAAAARRIDASTDFVDEVVQLARERLLVSAAPGEARVADYTGQGPLRAWVRIAAMRIAMNLLRDRRRNVLIDDESFFDTIQGGEAERRSGFRYADACADAMRVAFAALTARERNLLRMHHLHGLTLDELAPSLRVHRATVARWLVQAREHLLAETRAGLRARLAAGDETVDSILRELAGQIDISVRRMLADE
ncbi:MAG: sigma-70 family RNA polymerase sigma factor [Myxococcota bacterium]|nr:sigma-70 family RNA polymerase sigma factor [Myxococcota bacterium]